MRLNVCVSKWKEGVRECTSDKSYKNIEWRDYYIQKLSHEETKFCNQQLVLGFVYTSAPLQIEKKVQ